VVLEKLSCNIQILCGTLATLKPFDQRGEEKVPYFLEGVHMTVDIFERWDEDGDSEEEHPVVMAGLIITNKLYENVIEDAAERLNTIKQISGLGLDLENDPRAFRFLFKAIRKVAIYPMSINHRFFEKESDDE